MESLKGNKRTAYPGSQTNKQYGNQRMSPNGYTVPIAQKQNGTKKPGAYTPGNATNNQQGMKSSPLSSGNTNHKYMNQGFTQAVVQFRGAQKKQQQ